MLWRHLWPFDLHYICWHYLINGAIFGKKSLNIKCVFLFYLQLLSEAFLILTRIQRDIITNVKTSWRRVPLFLSNFNEIWILSRQIFEKVLNIKFYQNPSSGSQVVARGETDMSRLTVAFRNFANAPKNALRIYKTFCALKAATHCVHVLATGLMLTERNKG
jgi:hypothetical protein